jgi:hypothetical protein
MGISLMVVLIVLTLGDVVSRRVQLTSDLNDRARAETLVYSAYNLALYHLLTGSWFPTGVQIQPVETVLPALQTTDSPRFWNLYGEPIPMGDDVTVRLQDGAGLIAPLFNRGDFRRLVEHFSGDRGLAARWTDALADWCDQDDLRHLNGAERWDYTGAGKRRAPRNALAQSLEELMVVRGADREVFDRIKDFLIYWWPANVNYLTMDVRLLEALLGDVESASRIIELRRAGLLTPALFTRLTGIRETEDNIFRPSGLVRMDIDARAGGSRDRLRAVILKEETDARPFMVLEWRR